MSDLERHYWANWRTNKVADPSHIFSFGDLREVLLHQINADAKRARAEIAENADLARRRLNDMVAETNPSLYVHLHCKNLIRALLRGG